MEDDLRKRLERLKFLTGLEVNVDEPRLGTDNSNSADTDETTREGVPDFAAMLKKQDATQVAKIAAKTAAVSSTASASHSPYKLEPSKREKDIDAANALSLTQFSSFKKYEQEERADEDTRFVSWKFVINYPQSYIGNANRPVVSFNAYKMLDFND
jgi:hypothetical protein